MDITFLKITVKEISIKLPFGSYDDLQLELTHNRTSTIFHPPFSNLSLQLSSFLQNQELKISFLFNLKPLAEAIIVLYELLENPNANLPIQLYKQGKNTDHKEIHKEKVGSCRFCIIKEEIEAEDKSIDIDDKVKKIFDMSEKAFEEIFGVLKGNCKTNQGPKKLYKVNLPENLENTLMSTQKVKNIKYLLMGINEKLKVLGMLKDKNQRVENQLREKTDDYAKLQQERAEVLQDYGISEGKYESYIKNQQAVIDEFNSKISFLLSDNKKVKAQNENYVKEIEHLKASCARLSDEKRLYDDMQKTIDELKKAVLIESQAKTELKISLETLKVSHEKYSKESSEYIENLALENESLTKKCLLLQTSEKSLKSENSILKSQNLNLSSKNTENEKRLISLSDLQTKCSQYEKSSHHFKTQCLALQTSSSQQAENFSNLTKTHDQELKPLINRNCALATEICTLKKHLEHIKDSTNKGTIEDKKSTNAKTIEKAHVKAQIDISKMRIDLKSTLDRFRHLESNMSIIIDRSIKGYLELSWQYVSLQRYLHNVLKAMGDKEKEIPTLREMIAELQKGRDLYLPVSGDVIDNYLANFINSRKSKLLVPFVRLYHGMYLFGTKKVMIRIENSGLVIRVGGGFSNIDQFINSNTEIELEKCNERKKMQEINRSQSPESRDQNTPSQIDTGINRRYERKNSNLLGNDVLMKMKAASTPKGPIRTLKRRDTIV